MPIIPDAEEDIKDMVWLAAVFSFPFEESSADNGQSRAL